jgi:hypothetical protein
VRFAGFLLACRSVSRAQQLIFTPSIDIERYSDRFKLGQSSADGSATGSLSSLHEARGYDRGLLPSAAFEAIVAKEKKKRGRDGGSKLSRLESEAIATCRLC